MSTLTNIREENQLGQQQQRQQHEECGYSSAVRSTQRSLSAEPADSRPPPGLRKTSLSSRTELEQRLLSYPSSARTELEQRLAYPPTSWTEPEKLVPYPNTSRTELDQRRSLTRTSWTDPEQKLSYPSTSRTELAKSLSCSVTSTTELEQKPSCTITSRVEQEQRQSGPSTPRTELELRVCQLKITQTELEVSSSKVEESRQSESRGSSVEPDLSQPRTTWTEIEIFRSQPSRSAQTTTASSLAQPKTFRTERETSLTRPQTLWLSQEPGLPKQPAPRPEPVPSLSQFRACRPEVDPSLSQLRNSLKELETFLRQSVPYPEEDKAADSIPVLKQPAFRRRSSGSFYMPPVTSPVSCIPVPVPRESGKEQNETFLSNTGPISSSRVIPSPQRSISVDCHASVCEWPIGKQSVEGRPPSRGEICHTARERGEPRASGQARPPSGREATSPGRNGAHLLGLSGPKSPTRSTATSPTNPAAQFPMPHNADSSPVLRRRRLSRAADVLPAAWRDVSPRRIDDMTWATLSSTQRGRCDSWATAVHLSACTDDYEVGLLALHFKIRHCCSCTNVGTSTLNSKHPFSYNDSLWVRDAYFIKFISCRLDSGLSSRWCTQVQIKSS